MLATIGFVIGPTASGFIIPSGAVLVNMDPFFLLQKVLHIPIISALLSKTFRLFLCIYILQVGIISFRAALLTAVVSAMYRIEVLRVLTQLPLRKHNLKIYRENAIVTKIVYDFEFSSTRFGLMAMYFGIILSVNVIITGLDKQQLALVVITATFLIIQVFILQLFFKIGCSYFMFSSRILRNWNIDISNLCSSRRELRRIISSLRIISMPAGEAGIIDRDIKMNYMENLLGNLVDLIITRNSLY